MITIKDYTPYPITTLGERAGECWGADTSDKKKNFLRGVECINSDHGRTLEYPTIDFVLEGYSARVVREIYTNCVGVTKLQQSTRYVNCEEFDYFTPPSIKNSNEALQVYEDEMKRIKVSYKTLVKNFNIPKEDAANILPLAMETKCAFKYNLRALSNMAAKRFCTRTYHEYRSFLNELKQECSKLDFEWKLLWDNVLVAQCDRTGYCIEARSCGKYPKANKLLQVEDYKNYIENEGK